MQNNPNDMPKVVGLVVLILLVLGFGVWRVVQVTRATGTLSAASPTVETPNAAAMVASTAPPAAPQTLPDIAPGQMRELTALDEDPPDGRPEPPPRPRDDVFRIIRASVEPESSPVPDKTPPKGQMPAPANPDGKLPDLTSRPAPGGTRTLRPEEPVFVAPPTFIMQEVTLDGVVTGPDGFAMLTIHEGGGDPTLTDQTIYRRVGEKVAGRSLLEISEAGIHIRGMSRLWPVGQRLRIPVGTVPASALQRRATDSLPSDARTPQPNMVHPPRPLLPAEPSDARAPE
jgi:hypothetical protein